MREDASFGQGGGKEAVLTNDNAVNQMRKAMLVLESAHDCKFIWAGAAKKSKTGEKKAVWVTMKKAVSAKKAENVN